MKRYMTAVAAALLFAGAARADDEKAPSRAGDAVEERDRVRDGTAEGTPDRIRQHDRAQDGSADPLRERARERMHEALAEHAPRVPRADAVAGAAMRDRDRARDEMATRVAERHAQRAGAGEAHRRRGEDGVGAGGQGGMRHGGDCEAAGQRRMTEMRDGGMGGDGMMGGDGTRDGGGMTGGR